MIVNATTVSPKGTIDGKTRTFTIYDNGQMLKAAPWNDVIVAYKNGAPVRVRDIGRAIDAPENTRLAALANGKQAILLPIFKLPGANVIQTVDQHQGRFAAAAGGDPAGGQGPGAERPHADDPRLGRRRSVHLDAHHRSRRDGDLRLPAQPVGDDNPERRRAVGARRHLRDHVRAGLQPRQSVADGADDRGRFCRRRRDRHAREHRPPSRGWAEPDGGGDQGRRRDRLYDRVDQPLARRRVHSAIPDGRDRRPAVPRVRDHRVGDDPRLDAGLADPDADDVLALHAQQAAGPARPPLCAVGAGLRPSPRRLPQEPRYCAPPPPDDLCRVRRDIGGDRLSLRRHPEGLLPAAGYRAHHRHLGGGAGHLVRRRGAPPTRPRGHRRARILPSPPSA